MATCAIIGQAAGVAAALCVRHKLEPRALSTGKRLRELQETLMHDDCWLPGLCRSQGHLVKTATLSTHEGENAQALIDGIDRDRPLESHHWTGQVGVGYAQYRWDAPLQLRGVRLVFDSDLNNDKRMAHTYPQSGSRRAVPACLVRGYRVETCDISGRWSTLHRETDNYQRLVYVDKPVTATGVRLIPETTWGNNDEARVFAFEPQTPDEWTGNIPAIPSGPHFSHVRAQVSPQDLVAPDNGLENETGKVIGSA
jgi:hypothetical protein